MGINERLDPSLKGKARKKALLREWMVLQTTLPSTGTALAARLRQAFQGINPSLSVPGAGAPPDASQQEPAQTKGKEVPPIEPVSCGLSGLSV